MSSYSAKVYIVQRYDSAGQPGEIVAVKLTYTAAHAVAKDHAPAKVVFAVADKTPDANVVSRVNS